VRVNNVLQGSSGLGFAIPADTVAAVYREICETGEASIRRATIGANLRLQYVPPDQQQAASQRTGAVVVDEPLAGSPAAAAGLRRGDVILAFDGRPVAAPGAIYRLLDRSRIDKDCAIAFLRDGSPQTASIVPKERPRPDASEVSGA
jgi:serine protease Do